MKETRTPAPAHTPRLLRFWCRLLPQRSLLPGPPGTFQTSQPPRRRAQHRFIPPSELLAVPRDAAGLGRGAGAGGGFGEKRARTAAGAVLRCSVDVFGHEVLFSDELFL